MGATRFPAQVARRKLGDFHMLLLIFEENNFYLIYNMNSVVGQPVRIFSLLISHVLLAKDLRCHYLNQWRSSFLTNGTCMCQGAKTGSAQPFLLTTRSFDTIIALVSLINLCGTETTIFWANSVIYHGCRCPGSLHRQWHGKLLYWMCTVWIFLPWILISTTPDVPVHGREMM